MSKSVCMLNSRANNLDVILSVGKPAKNMKGLGYIGDPSIPKTNFVPPTLKAETKMSRTNAYATFHILLPT